MTFLTQPIWVCPYLTQIWIKTTQHCLECSDKLLYSFVDDLLHVQQCKFSKNTIKYVTLAGTDSCKHFLPFSPTKRANQICKISGDEHMSGDVQHALV